jgi:hypothetical protein
MRSNIRAAALKTCIYFEIASFAGNFKVDAHTWGLCPSNRAGGEA